MSGVETVRGIGYQQAHAVLEALAVLESPYARSLRVEGVEDVMDIEVHGPDGKLISAKQVKSRSGRPWNQKALVDIFKSWGRLNAPVGTVFEIVTDGGLGPGAERLDAALSAARRGEYESVAAFLRVEQSDPLCALLGSAFIRIEPSGVEPVLQKAEQIVRSMLPSSRPLADLQGEARRVVNDLFTFLTERASRADAAERVIAEHEIGEVLGGVTYIKAPDRWPGSLKDGCLVSNRSENLTATIVLPKLRRRTMSNEVSEPDARDVLDLLGVPKHNVVAGPTGAGKSTAIRYLVKAAAAVGVVVVRLRAETYLPGHLDVSVAAALSSISGREIARATANQVLGDRSVTIVIDGVSEVPRSTQRALRDELSARESGLSGSRIILVGRDLAALRAVAAPGAVEYEMAPFDDAARRTAAADFIRRAGVRSVIGDPNRLAAQVEAAIGDAASNPMLFGMALQMLEQGIPFENRCALYRGSVRLTTKRSQAANPEVVEAVLGIVFSRLLNDGRRFCGPLEWGRLLAESVLSVAAMGVQVELEDVRDSVHRSGLVGVIDDSEVVAPIHDSYADYFAGVAMSNASSPWPERLVESDEQRVLFAAELGRIDSANAEAIARDLPYLAVRAGRFPSGGSLRSTEEIAKLYRLLAPYDPRGVQTWRIEGRLIAHLVEGPTAELTETEGRALLYSTSTVVSPPNASPLETAAALWRLVLHEKLQPTKTAVKHRYPTVEQTRTALENHFNQTAAETRALVRSLAPAAGAARLAQHLEPADVHAVIYSQREDFFPDTWPVRYRKHSQTLVELAAKPETDERLPGWGSTSANHILGKSPGGEARDRLREALNAIVQIKHWI